MIKTARKRKGMTQEELAWTLGVAQSTVSAWESGTLPRKEHLLKLTALLECTLDDLLGEREGEGGSPNV